MRLAAYSDTGRSLSASAASVTPRAWPSLRVDWGSRLTKVSSTAASCGLSRSISAVSAQWIAASRSASEAAASVWIDPQATKESLEPAASISPQPVLRRPGSTPRIRITAMFMECLLYETAPNATSGSWRRIVRGEGLELAFDAAKLAERGAESPAADRLPDIRGARGETRDRDRKPGRLGDRALFVDEV